MSLLLSCQGLSKNYGAKQAVSQVSFDVHKGEPIALVGENGAGKTTLISMMCGFISPTSGKMIYANNSAGMPITLGALPQDAVLDSGFSIQTQLNYLARLQGFNRIDANKEVDKVLELVDLSDSEKEKPDTLSHGMSKRISIAQALIGSPDVILLDEPTAGLDPKNSLKIRDCIQRLKNDVTFVISSHNLTELERVCGHVLYLEQGKLTRNEPLQTTQTHQYLTIVFNSSINNEFVAKINMIKGVNRVERKQTDEVLIEYKESDLASSLEVEILTLMNQSYVDYKHIQKGLSLENKLYV